MKLHRVPRLPLPTPDEQAVGASRPIQINCNVSGAPIPPPRIKADDGTWYAAAFDGPARCAFVMPSCSPPAGWGAYIFWADGQSYRFPMPLTPGSYEASDLGIPTLDYAPPVPPTPPVPSRLEVLGVNMSFRGGLLVESSQYGRMPWWDSCLAWCNPQTRQAAYDQKRAVGDTHQIIHVPSGSPLYDEYAQFYSPDKFGALDWTAGETQLDSRFSDLVDEVIAKIGKFIITMDERQPNSTRIVQLVMRALSDEQLQYGFVMPGYDGVFYGWDPLQVKAWADLARAIKPNAYLGLEHQPGRIPLGEGGEDYKAGGRMDGFDVVLGEFDDNLHQDSTWQILGRMIRPYNRPAEQPAGDDPNPPFYLVDSPRGPRVYVTFETYNPYKWVRVDPYNDAAVAGLRNQIAGEKTYLASLGSKYFG